MVSYIQLVVFGNFERFSTQNANEYIKLIQFWQEKSYQPSSVNQLRMNDNGMTHTIIMPVFIKNNRAFIEILGDRINFKLLNQGGEHEKQKFTEMYVNEMYQNSIEFMEKFQISGNRVALHCEEISSTEEGISFGEDLLEGCSNIEKSERVLCRKTLCDEVCNIAKETLINKEQQRCFYDFNTLFENNTSRFNATVSKDIFSSFVDILNTLI